MGWIFDGVTRCIKLPKAKVGHIDNAITAALQQKGIKWKEYEKLLGKSDTPPLVYQGAEGSSLRST